MTITLSPETEARLRRKAERDKQDVNALASTLLDEVLADDPDDLAEEEVAQIRAGIRRGLEAAAQGRERSVDEYAAEVERRQTESEAKRRENGG